jgi:hypothetical protein
VNYLKNDRWEDDNPDDEQPDDERYYDHDSYASDAYGDDANESTRACPFCGREIYDDAVRCPQCGNYVSWSDADEDGDRSAHAPKRPRWVIVTAVLLIYAMLHAYLWPIIALWLRG